MDIRILGTWMVGFGAVCRLWQEALKLVQENIDDFGIRYCGRFGDWEYLWIGEAFMNGENFVQQVLGNKLSTSVI